MVFQTVIGGYSSLDLVSWSNGSYEQIAAMLDAHYKGRINIANYWSIGDTRTITLDAIAQTNVTSAMSTQVIQLVLLNAGGKTLVQSQYGTNTCAFVVGIKNVLSSSAAINTSTVSKYSTSAIRSVLNNQVYSAFPSDMKLLMKSFVNKTTIYEYSGASASLEETEDLVCLAGANEVFGYPNSWDTLAGEGTQFTYYTTQANRIKKRDSVAETWWTRSAMNYAQNVYTATDGSIAAIRSDYSNGLAPIFVI